jgi:hypothetical protein
VPPAPETIVDPRPAGSFGEAANAAERLQPTMRGIQRNRVMLARMVTAAQLVERYTPSGLYLGHGYTVPVVAGVQQRVISRIVRGLYSHHFQTRLGDDAQVTLVFIDKNKPQWREALYTFRNLELRHVVIGDGDTFQYLYGRAKDDPAFSVWLVIFFKRHRRADHFSSHAAGLTPARMAELNAPLPKRADHKRHAFVARVSAHKHKI